MEEKTRKEKRIYLNEQSIRLGRYTTHRQGTKCTEIWEKGEAFKKLELQIHNLARERGEIEKLKRSRGASNSKRSS